MRLENDNNNNEFLVLNNNNKSNFFYYNLKNKAKFNLEVVANIKKK